MCVLFVDDTTVSWLLPTKLGDLSNSFLNNLGLLGIVLKGPGPICKSRVEFASLSEFSLTLDQISTRIGFVQTGPDVCQSVFLHPHRNKPLTHVTLVSISLFSAKGSQAAGYVAMEVIKSL